MKLGTTTAFAMAVVIGRIASFSLTAVAGEPLNASCSILVEYDWNNHLKEEPSHGTDLKERNACNSVPVKRIFDYTGSSRHQASADFIDTASAFYLYAETESESQCHAGQYLCRGRCISYWQACEDDSIKNSFNAASIFHRTMNYQYLRGPI